MIYKHESYYVVGVLASLSALLSIFNVLPLTFGFAAGISYYILIALGRFNVVISPSELVAKEQNQESLPVILAYYDKEGNVSKLIIHANGKIETEGNVSPELIERAKELSDAVTIFGADAVAEALKQEIEKRQKEKR